MSMDRMESEFDDVVTTIEQLSKSRKDATLVSDLPVFFGTDLSNNVYVYHYRCTIERESEK